VVVPVPVPALVPVVVPVPVPVPLPVPLPVLRAPAEYPVLARSRLERPVAAAGRARPR
jgi:hypothetical protein